MVATDEGAALLRAVLDADREDDTVRLVYADWLQDNEQEERAEFIRVQVAGRTLPKLPTQAVLRGICGPVLSALFERELPSKQYSVFVASGRTGTLAIRGSANNEYEPHPDGDPDYARPLPRLRAFVRRGFVSELTCPAADWLAHADAITAAHPIERVRLTGATGADLLATFGRVKSRSREAWEVLPAVEDNPGPRFLAALAVLWPGIAFDLPPDEWRGPGAAPGGSARWTEFAAPGAEPVQWNVTGRLNAPPEGAAFLAGLDWRIEVREEPSVTYAPPVVTAELYAEALEPVPGHLLGAFFGPVQATDTFGRRWHVERAVFAEYDVDRGVRGHARSRLHARSAGAVRPARRDGLDPESGEALDDMLDSPSYD